MRLKVESYSLAKINQQANFYGRHISSPLSFRSKFSNSISICKEESPNKYSWQESPALIVLMTGLLGSLILSLIWMRSPFGQKHMVFRQLKLRLGYLTKLCWPSRFNEILANNENCLFFFSRFRLYHEVSNRLCREQCAYKYRICIADSKLIGLPSRF